MRKSIHWMLTAAMGLGAAAFAGCDRNDPAKQTSNAEQDKKVINNKNDAASVAGSTIPGDQIGAADLTKIYGVLGDAVKGSFKKGAIGDVVERFDKADRDRLGKVTSSADLDGRIDQLNKDYKAKYNADFDIDDSKTFENWVKVQKTGQTSDKTMANVMVPASHGAPAVTIPVVKDAVAWKIDLNDSVSADQLKKALLDHLTEADNMKDQWPADKLEAQRALSHHVFEAIANMPTAK